MAKKRRDLKKQLCSAQSSDRKEVEAAVDSLVKEVAHLALRIKQAVAVCGTAKAELTRRAVGASGMRDIREANAPLQFNPTAPSLRDPQAVETAEAAMFPLSPRQSCNDKGGFETNFKTCLTQDGPLPTGPNVENNLQENSVAARVAELRERLGGFITPSPSISGRKR